MYSSVTKQPSYFKIKGVKFTPHISNDLAQLKKSQRIPK